MKIWNELSGRLVISGNNELILTKDPTAAMVFHGSYGKSVLFRNLHFYHAGKSLKEKYRSTKAALKFIWLSKRERK